MHVTCETQQLGYTEKHARSATDLSAPSLSVTFIKLRGVAEPSSLVWNNNDAGTPHGSSLARHDCSHNLAYIVV